MKRKPLACTLIAVLIVSAILSGCGSSKSERRPVAYPPADRETQPPAVEQYQGDRTLVVASWYGKDFHGRPTASGELFDMHALTCAHRQLPFGTRLRVTNPANGKDVECTINDRGPFIPGRDLDLSYGTAQRINLIAPGHGKVHMQEIGRDLSYVKAVRYSGTASGTVTIQLGSFREPANAERLKKGLEFQYNNIYIMKTVVRGETHYRVRMGKFTGRSSARQIAYNLAQNGYDVLITRYEKN